jgi:hypothetical protein
MRGRSPKVRKSESPEEAALSFFMERTKLNKANNLSDFPTFGLPDSKEYEKNITG